MFKTDKVVTIGGKDYTINSNNFDLQKAMPIDKSGSKTVPFLPIATVYDLLDGLFDDYIIDFEKTDPTGEAYESISQVGVDKVKDVQKVFGTTATITLFMGNDTKTVRGYATGVAGPSILSKDTPRDGFASKVEARAIKKALKQVGKVFRISGEDEDDLDMNQLTPDEKQTKKEKEASEKKERADKIIEETKKNAAEKKATTEVAPTPAPVVAPAPVVEEAPKEVEKPKEVAPVVEEKKPTTPSVAAIVSDMGSEDGLTDAQVIDFSTKMGEANKKKLPTEAKNWMIANKIEKGTTAYNQLQKMYADIAARP